MCHARSRALKGCHSDQERRFTRLTDKIFCEPVPKPKPWADCCSITNARFANKLAAPALRLCQAQTATGLFAPSKLAVVEWGLHICTWRSGGLGLAPMQCWEQAQCGRMPTGWASNLEHTMLRARERCATTAQIHLRRSTL